MTNEERNKLYIGYLARSMFKFAYWAENEWPGREDSGDSQDRKED